MSPIEDVDLSSYIKHCQQQVDSRLSHWLSLDNSVSKELAEAMRYATFNGGKRIRPVLVFATAKALGIPEKNVVDAACAIEMVHAYSLVHDDLPAMDDDDLRRGKPTCHIAFDESTAILAGDALQCFAYEILTKSDQPGMTPTAKLTMIQQLAIASGTQGMAGGQALDLASEERQLSLEALETIHQHKTGRLIRACIEMSATLLPPSDFASQQTQDLVEYANIIGLAFQVQDDILDVISDTETLGKQQGADSALNKATYPGILGLEAAQNLAQELNAKAKTALHRFDERANILRSLADYIVSRSH